MVATPKELQRLSASDDSVQTRNWSAIQIAAPVIVGGSLLLIFVAYFYWQRGSFRIRSYTYQQVRSDWVNKVERIFVPRRKRLRVLHSSAPLTIDDSMRASSLALDFRRVRAYRSGSTDSQTPLTTTNYTFDYPPNKRVSDSPPSQTAPERRPLRWWWLFGSRPQEIRSAEPGSRWRVDDPDGSSSGHGHSNHGHPFTRALEAVDEDEEEIADDVIRIGGDFVTPASTPMTQHFPESARVVQGMSTVPEHPGSSGTRTPLLDALRSGPGTPMSSSMRGLPPSYDASQNQIRFASPDHISHQPCSGPACMIVPPPVCAAGYLSPRAFHGRELSSESFLATQPPMATTSIY